jgi:hypothetical protein
LPSEISQWLSAALLKAAGPAIRNPESLPSTCRLQPYTRIPG